MADISQNPLIDERNPLDTIESSQRVIEAVSAMITGHDDLHLINERALSGIINIFRGATQALEHATDVLSTEWKAEYNKNAYDLGYQQGLKEGQEKSVAS